MFQLFAMLTPSLFTHNARHKRREERASGDRRERI